MISFLKICYTRFSPYYLVIIIFLLFFGYEITISNCGLDLNDGAWSLLKASFPESEEAGLTRDSYYMNSLMRLFSGNIAALRITSLILILSSLLIFTLGFAKVSKTNFLNKKISVFFLFILFSITTLPCFWIERQPTYNTLGAFSFFSIIGTFLYAISLRFKNSYSLYNKLLLLIGFTLALGFLCRPPTIVPTLIILFLIYYYFFRFEKIFSTLLNMILGLIFGFIFHLFFFESPQTLLAIYKNGIHLSNIVYTESISEKLTRQGLEIISAWHVALGRQKYVIALLFIVIACLPKSRFWLLAPAIIWTTFSSYHYGDLNGGLSLFFNYYRFWSSLGFVLFPIIFINLNIKDISAKNNSVFLKELNIAVLLLFSYLVIPLFCSIGAGSTLLYMSNFYSCIHSLILIIAISRLHQYNVLIRRHWSLLILLLCLGPATTFYNSRINSTFFAVDGSSVEDCIAVTEVGFLPTKIKMHPKQSKFVNSLKFNLLSNGYNPGNRILNFTNLPGLLYAVGGNFSIHAWTNTHHGSPIPYFMKKSSIDDIKNSWIFLDTIAWSERLEISFESRNLKVAETHQEIGIVDWVKIYKPKSF